MGLSGALTHLLLSPLPFIAAILCGAVLALRGRRRTGFWLTTAAAILLTAASLEPVHDALLSPLEDSSPPLPAAEVPRLGAIVVLGGGLSAAPAAAGLSEAPSASSLGRLAYACALSRDNGAVIVVCGGRVMPGDREPEAEVSRRTLLALGVPAARILMEAESSTTWENARRAAPLVSGRGAVALVTSAWHMPRGLLAFSRAGVRCTAAPTDYLTRRAPYDPYSFIPSFPVLAESFTALREYAGFAAYWLRRR
jgi:uncharacterized SAM-binding protein YcdF (DUF218 family)